jgi:hypothetical protein
MTAVNSPSGFSACAVFSPEVTSGQSQDASEFLGAVDPACAAPRGRHHGRPTTTMKTIPAHTVDEIWQRVFESDPQESRVLAERMQQEQPFIMIYLMAAEETLLGEEERGEMLMLGAFVWQALSSKGPLRRVTDTELTAAEAANVGAIEKLDEGPEMDLTAGLGALVANYNQMPLLGAVLETLMAGHEDAPELAPEHVGMALIHLKTVVDCLDQ